VGGEYSFDIEGKPRSRKQEASRSFLGNAVAQEYETAGKIIASDLRVDKTLGLDKDEEKFVSLLVGKRLMQERIFRMEHPEQTDRPKTGSVLRRLLTAPFLKGQERYRFEWNLPAAKRAQPIYNELSDVYREDLIGSSGEDRVRTIEKAIDDILTPVEAEGNPKPPAAAINKRISPEVVTDWAQRWRDELAKTSQKKL
jgi:hypothetical protein